MDLHYQQIVGVNCLSVTSENCTEVKGREFTAVSTSVNKVSRDLSVYNCVGDNSLKTFFTDLKFFPTAPVMAGIRRIKMPFNQGCELDRILFEFEFNLL